MTNKDVMNISFEDLQVNNMMDELAEHMVLSTKVHEGSNMDIVKDSLKTEWIAHPEMFKKEWKEYEQNGGVKI